MRRLQRHRRLAAVALAGLLAPACLPGNPMVTETGASGTGESESESESATGAGEGLFGCSSASCTFVVVSQTLDDRVDVFGVEGSSHLQARIALDLKPDPSGLQVAGNLLDEPYGIDVVGEELRVLVGHYPDTERGSLVVLPEQLFAGLEAGSVVSTSELFDGIDFVGGARSIELERQEAIFALPHSSGKMIVGVFANDLRAIDWPNTSELLIVDPAAEGEAAIGAFDLGGLDVACQGAWGMIAADDPVNPGRVALACDGSDSVAMLELPDLGAMSAGDAAAAISGCGVKLLEGDWTTRFLAPDGAGGVLAIQSQLVSGPRLWRVGGECQVAPASESVAEEFGSLRVLSEAVLLEGGGDPTWLVAGGVPSTGVYVIKGADPQLCGRVSGLENAFTPAGGSANAPYALALADDALHLAIGSGPPSNPESAEGRGQVHWATLDTSGIASCEVAVTALDELTEGLFVDSDPKTWVRAPNVLKIVQRSGEGR